MSFMMGRRGELGVMELYIFLDVLCERLRGFVIFGLINYDVCELLVSDFELFFQIVELVMFRKQLFIWLYFVFVYCECFIYIDEEG